MKQSLKNKAMSFLMALIMVLAIMPVSGIGQVYGMEDESAEKKNTYLPMSTDEFPEITVTGRAQADSTFVFPSKSISVAPGIGKEYGYENDESIENGEISALDVLVAIHKELFGDDFSVDTKDDYLSVSAGGWITKIFAEETTASGFTVNGEQPHGEWVEAYKSYLGYSVNQAKISENDIVEFFVLGKSDWTDYASYFTYNNERKDKIEVELQDEISLNLRGLSICYYGLSDDETKNAMTQNLCDCQIGYLDEYGVFTAIDGLITDENGMFNITFSKEGSYVISAIGDGIICPYLEVSVTRTPRVPQFTDEIPDDFENDLWLPYDYKEMSVGDTAEIYPRRVPQILSNYTQNDVARPNFYFDIIEGNSVEISDETTTDEAQVRAIAPGTSVVMVTYDELLYKDKLFGKISPVNIGYVIYSVGDEGSVKIETDIPYTSYDTVYFSEGNYINMPFSVRAEGAENVVVTCNGEEIEKVDDLYNAPLKNRSNIIGVVATDATGAKSSYYKVVDGRKIDVSIENKTTADGHFYVGDTVNISFKGITNPVYKIAQIYNPTFNSPMFGSYGTSVDYYINDNEEPVSGFCNQYDLATQNTITLQLGFDGKYNLHNGEIYSQWWGAELGEDKISKICGGASVSISGTYEGMFSAMPDITFSVLPKDAQPVNSVALNKTTAQMETGDTLELNCTIEPFNAVNQNVSWSSSDKNVATVSEEGKVTALSVGSAIITVTTEDGGIKATCKVEVLSGGGGGGSSTDKVKITIDKLTINKGYVLQNQTVEINSGDSVWDVTKKLLDEKKIDYKSSTGSQYNSVYVEEIDGDGEFDNGSGSGWMYSVNGTFPKKGCSSYVVKSGDVIRWRYTLNLGADIGGSNFTTDDNKNTSSGGSSSGHGSTQAVTVPTAVTKEDKSFSDIKDNWAREHIEYLVEKGIITGKSEDVFAPEDNITRAEFVAMLYRISGTDSSQYENEFGDVSADDWFSKYAAWGKNAKITLGDENNRFLPNEYISREQIAAMVVRFAEFINAELTEDDSVDNFSDNDEISDYAMDAVKKIAGSKIVTGRDDKTFAPKDFATRAEVSKILSLFMKRI